MSGIDELPPAPGAPSFGEELRKEREMRGISLKEIADATKISRRFLEAIEKNDMRTLPAPVFTRGFVREYARYLGLNTEEMVTRYGDYIRTIEEAEAGNQPSLARPISVPHEQNRTISRAPIQSERRSIGPFLIGAVVALALVGAVMAALRFRPMNRTKKTGGVTVKTAAAAPIAAAPVPAQPPASGLLMEINFTEKTWLSAQADGKFVVNDEIEAGEHRTVRANETIVFKTLGNAGGVEITLNGRKLDPLGGSGDVRHNVRFDRQSLEELKSRT